MTLAKTIKDIVKEELKSVHCAFLAKVLSVSVDKAKIQPLGLIRDYGEAAKKQAPLTGVHIARSARYKISSNDGEAKLTAISKGDVVLCVCCDRNIDAALKGENSLPPVGFHKQSDCVIVAII